MKIITPPTVEPVSLETARQHCRLDVSGDSPAHPDDELLQLYITAAREWAEGYLGHFVAQAVVETNLDAFPAAGFELESGPVSEVQAIGHLDSDGEDVLVDVADYVLDTREVPAVARLVSGAAWPTVTTGTGIVFARYAVGYAEPPKSVVAAILLVTAHLYRNRESSTSEALQEVPLGAKALLDLAGRTRLGMA